MYYRTVPIPVKFTFIFIISLAKSIQQLLGM